MFDLQTCRGAVHAGAVSRRASPARRRRAPMRSRTLRVACGRGALVALAVSAGVVALSAPAARSATLPYQDPSQPVPARVADLMSRMSLDDKLGQMTQAERLAASPSDVAANRLGSVLSGGGSTPSANSPGAWADMYDASQRAATGTPLGVPIIYGADAVHGHNNVNGATIFPHNIALGATRDPALVQQIAARPPRRFRHGYRLGLRALSVRGPRRPLGQDLRILRRDARARLVDDQPHHRLAGDVAGRAGVRARHGQALHRRRRDHRRQGPGRYPAQRGGPSGPAPAA